MKWASRLCVVFAVVSLFTASPLLARHAHRKHEKEDQRARITVIETRASAHYTVTVSSGFPNSLSLEVVTRETLPTGEAERFLIASLSTILPFGSTRTILEARIPDVLEVTEDGRHMSFRLDLAELPRADISLTNCQTEVRDIPPFSSTECCSSGNLSNLPPTLPVEFTWDLTRVSPTTGPFRGSFRSVTGAKFDVRGSVLKGEATGSGKIVGFEVPGGLLLSSSVLSVARRVSHVRYPPEVTFVPDPLTFPIPGID